MKKNGRPVDPNFSADEKLYRRVRPGSVHKGKVHIDAIELPDISTMRDKYCNDPEWVLIDTTRRHDFSTWGIATITIKDIPEETLWRGIETIQTTARHKPLRDNYPHTEIQAHRGDDHISSREDLPPEFHLQFRLRIAQTTKIVKQPQH